MQTKTTVMDPEAILDSFDNCNHNVSFRNVVVLAVVIRDTLIVVFEYCLVIPTNHNHYFNLAISTCL